MRFSAPMFHPATPCKVAHTGPGRGVSHVFSLYRLGLIGDLGQTEDSNKTLHHLDKLDVETDRIRQTQPRKEVSGPGHELELRQMYLEERIEKCVRITDALKLLISRCGLPFG